MDLLNILLNICIYIIIISSSMIILSKNPVHSVFYLVLVFCLSACLIFLLKLDFIGVIFIVIYVGAVAVLFLFVVMMLNVKTSEYQQKYVTYLPLGVLVIGTLFLFIYSSFIENFDVVYDNDTVINWINLKLYNNNIKNIGYILYSYMLLHFICSGVILLVAMLGAIVLTLNHKYSVRRQEIYKQVGRSTNKVKTYY